MKKIYYLLLSVLLAMLLMGCSSEEEGMKITLYYINSDENNLVEEEYYLKTETKDEQVKELLEVLSNADHNVNYHSAIPKDVPLESYRIREKHVELVFGEGYSKLPKGREVLLRAAMVKSLVQIPGVNFASFYVGESQLMDSTGTVVGFLRAEDFVENTGSALKTFQETDLKLFFANKGGTALALEERKDVHYSINTSIEKLVVEQLLKGTNSDKRSSTIQSGVQLLGVSVKDGVCYVNFDSSFLNGGFNQAPEVTIYSIVNSIIANGNATKVQILVDGSSDVIFMGTMDLKQPFEWKTSIVGS